MYQNDRLEILYKMVSYHKVAFGVNLPDFFLPHLTENDTVWYQLVPKDSQKSEIGYIRFV